MEEYIFEYIDSHYDDLVAEYCVSKGVEVDVTKDYMEDEDFYRFGEAEAVEAYHYVDTDEGYDRMVEEGLSND